MSALLIILSGFTGLSEGVLVKRYNEKHGKGGFIFTAFISLFSMLFFLFKDIITDKSGFTIDAGIIPYGIISGILYCAASFLTYIALGCGPFAISMLILSYAGVFSIIYGLVFLGEPASVFTYIGLALIMISLYLTRSESKKDGEEKKISLKWIICIAISVFGSGMFSVIMRMQQIKFNYAYDNEFMVLSLGISAISLFIIGLIKNGRELGYTMRHGLIYGVGAGASNGATNTISLILNTMMAISISSPIRTAVRIILSFVCSIFIFKEKFLKRQLIGVVLGGIALIFLNF